MAIRVLVVDDSALVRKILTVGLNANASIEVVGSASDPYAARDEIMRLKPDVMTLDVEMPRMDGVEFLRKLMPQRPMPVIMVSSLTRRGQEITLSCLEAGAVDFVPKPASKGPRALEPMLAELQAKVLSAATVDVSRFRQRGFRPSSVPKTALGAMAGGGDDRTLIAIGASTGGTEAFRAILNDLPANLPGIVLVQHMPGGFTKLYAERLDESHALEVREANDGDAVIPGRVLVAPGGRQLTVKGQPGNYRIRLGGEERVNGHAPSVDVMMQSVAECAGSNGLGVILTGMGGDGANGLKQMRDAGARTLGQDQESSVVYGMPKVAFSKGAVEKQLPLDEMAAGICSLLKQGRRI